MALGSGGKHLVREAVTWLGVVAAGACTAYYFDDALALLRTSSKVVQQIAEVRSDETASLNEGFERVVRLKGDRRGHFDVRAYINGRPIALMADTGATVVALTYQDARRAGFNPGPLDFTGRTRTANGIAKVAPITIDRVRVGDIMVRNVRGIVAAPGKLSVSLLGMSFIGKLTRFELRGKELVLIQ
ncbi:MAG: retropepsin-like aspartic protease family protein [Methyloligellaceae bacterium]